MDYRLEWSPEAIEDVQNIAEHIGEDSEFYARAMVSKILAIAQSIWEFPRWGRAVPEFEDENLRERFVYSYRLIYRLEAERILMVAVIHGKRLLESVAERFKVD